MIATTATGSTLADQVASSAPDSQVRRGAGGLIAQGREGYCETADGVQERETLAGPSGYDGAVDPLGVSDEDTDNYDSDYEY